MFDMLRTIAYDNKINADDKVGGMRQNYGN
jgi:hypothetical protein